MKKIFAALTFCTCTAISLFCYAATQSFTWQTPATNISATSVDVSGGNFLNQSVGVDQNGNAIAIYSILDNSTGQQILVADRKLAGQTWSQATTAQVSTSSSGFGVNGGDMQLAVAPDGTAVAIWVSITTPGNVCTLFASQASTTSSTFTWSTPEALSDAFPGITTITWAFLGVGPDGTFSTSWLETAPTNILYNSTKYPGQSWNHTTLDNSLDGNAYPWVVIDMNGNITATWDHGGVPYAVRGATRLKGQPWDTFQQITPNDTFNHFRSTIAVDSAGNVYGFCAVIIAAGNTAIYQFSKPFGGSWSFNTTPFDNIGATTGTDGPRIVMNPNGYGTAVWWRSSTATGATNLTNLRYTTKTPNGSWTTPANVSTTSINVNPTGGFQRRAYPPVIDLSNNLIVMYADGSATTTSLIKAQTNAFISDSAGWSGWSTAQTLSAAAAFLPSMVEDIYSEAFAVWQQGISPNVAIQAIQGLFLPSSSSSVGGSQKTNNFGLVKEFCNQINWTPSSSPVSGYYIYRNGQRIASVGSSTLQYNDHDQPKGQPTTYGISPATPSGEGAQTTVVVP